MTDPPARQPLTRIPKSPLIATAVLIVCALTIRFGWQTLQRWTGLEPTVAIIASALCLAGIYLLWMGWVIWFSGWMRVWRWSIAALMLAAPTVAMTLLKPVVGGDLDIVRWDWRFWDRSRSLQQAPSSVAQAEMTDAAPPSWNFPEFLGVGRRAIVNQPIRLDPNWNATPPRLIWKIDVGEGWAGISAVDGCAYTLEQRGDRECVTCYRISDGKLVWSYNHIARHEDTLGLGKAGPRSTPTVDEGRVYAQGATGIVVCLNRSDGTLIWKRDLCEQLGIDRKTGTNLRGLNYQEEPALAWGRAASPLVVDSMLIVPGGGNLDGPKTTLLAFDKWTGDELWRGGDEMIGYGSPSLARIGGTRQILLVAEQCAMGFAPSDGSVLWRVDRPGSSTGSANCSQVTVVSDYHVLLSKGYQLGGQLVALNWENDQWRPETIWSLSRVLNTKLTNPVISDGHAYALSNGFFECVRLDQGELRWRQRGRFGHGQILLAGEFILVHSEHGVMTLVRASPDRYEPLGEFQTIQGVCWNTFCLYGPYLLVRSDLEMACFELPRIADALVDGDPQ